VLAGVLGIVLGYVSSRFQFRRWMVQQTSVTQALSVGTTADVSADAPRISSLAEALKAVPAAPKGEDEHHHYGI